VTPSASDFRINFMSMECLCLTFRFFILLVSLAVYLISKAHRNGNKLIGANYKTGKWFVFV
jgi:hypothetical protein